MKHIFTFLLCGISLSLLSQPSFKLYFTNTSNEVAPNTILQITSVPLDEIKVVLDIVNTSTVQTHIYDVKRYDIIVHNNGVDDIAEPYFCFGSQCYPNITQLSAITLTLNPGQNSNVVGTGPDSAFYSLNIDLKEASVRGLSEVKYTIFNTLNPNDSVQVTARYNDPQFVSFTRHTAVQNNVRFQPNPAKESTQFIVSATALSEARLQLINGVGQVVYSQVLSLSSGKNTIPLQVSSLASGVYIAQFNEGGKVTSQKLIIE